VVYLSEAARAAIKANRELDRAIGAKPLTDSAFIERAILCHARRSQQRVRVSDAARQLAKARQAVAMFKEIRDLKSQENYLLQVQVERLTAKLQSTGVRARHQAGLSRPFLDLQEAMRTVILAQHKRLDEARQLHELVARYLGYLGS
jgi:hypothetical protein